MTTTPDREYKKMLIKTAIGFKTKSATEILMKSECSGYSQQKKLLEELLDEGEIEVVREDGHTKYRNCMI